MVLSEKQKSDIEEIYIEMYSSLSMYAIVSLNESNLAEEAVQDTFRIACSKPDPFLSSLNPNGWLVNTLKYVIRNMINNRSKTNHMIISSLDIIEIAASEDADSSNVDLLYSDIVSSEDYRLLKKIALEKYTMLEAATELGISVEACKKRVQRAKKKMKKYL